VPLSPVYPWNPRAVACLPPGGDEHHIRLVATPQFNNTLLSDIEEESLRLAGAASNEPAPVACSRATCEELEPVLRSKLLVL